MLSWPRFRFPWALALALVAICQEIHADDAATLISLSTAFETARVSGDVESAKRLTIADARWIVESDKDASLILSDVEATSRRLSEGKGEPSDSFVAERNVEIFGDSAVVTELVRVTKGPPIRRSAFWVHDAGTHDAGTWKIAHVHMSPYLRWESAISAFETADQKDPPKPGGVVFIGSSSIRRWESLANDFPEARVLNRGFGGSQMIDSVLFAKRIVTPYAPAAVAVYAGDNDIGKGKNADRVFGDFKNFVASIHDQLPDTKIAFIAIKPSLKRWDRWDEIRRANQLIQDFAANHSNVDYLDIATPMLGDDGMPRKELFVSDGLHLTEQGYAVWTEAIRPWVNTFAVRTAEAREQPILSK